MADNTSTEESIKIGSGIFYGLLACFYWSLVFVIPGRLNNISPLEITLARYICFGLFSLALGLSKLRSIYKQPIKLWIKSLVWSTLINPIYYLGVVLGLKYAGAAPSILIAGLSPITIIFYSNLKSKQISLPILSTLSLCMLGGVILTNISEFHQTINHSISQYIFGILCNISTAGIWTLYIIKNKNLLKNHTSLSPSSWSAMLGISSLAVCAPCLIIANALNIVNLQSIFSTNTVWIPYLIGSSIMGIFSSFFATSLWNKASQRVPSSILGSMLIFEPIFGLGLTFIMSKSLPSTQEAIGILMVINSSLIGLLLFGRKSKEAISSNNEEVTNLEPAPTLVENIIEDTNTLK